VVVVVDGVMTIQGDGNTVHKAKDHSRVASSRENSSSGELKISQEPGESSHARESRMR
jgi:hypothetical protein